MPNNQYEFISSQLSSAEMNELVRSSTPFPAAYSQKQNPYEEFFKVVTSNIPLTKTNEKKIAQQIRKGTIRPDALICVYDKHNSCHEKFSPLELMLEVGEQADEIFDALLEVEPDPNHLDGEFAGSNSHYHPLLRRAIFLNSVYLDKLINSPVIDIDTPVTINLPVNHTIIDECIAAIVGNQYRHNSFSTDEAACYLIQLMKRGAVIKPERLEQLMPSVMDTPYIELPAIIAGWQQEWADFTAGTLPATALTPHHISHFYALGHLEDCLNSPLIRNHERHVLGCALSLPEWAFNPSQNAREIIALSGRNTPEPVIQFADYRSPLQPFTQRSEAI